METYKIYLDLPAQEELKKEGQITINSYEAGITHSDEPLAEVVIKLTQNS